MELELDVPEPQKIPVSEVRGLDPLLVDKGAQLAAQISQYIRTFGCLALFSAEFWTTMRACRGEMEGSSMTR